MLYAIVLMSLFVVVTFLLTKPSVFVSIAGSIICVGVPAQVRADGHAQELRCIHRFQFLVMHEVSGLNWTF